MGGAVREVLAGVGVCLLVAAVLAFVFAGTWYATRPPGPRGTAGRRMIDGGLALAALGVCVAVAGLLPVRSPGSPETLPAATTVAPTAPAANRPGDMASGAQPSPR
ncbi:hypothetical protein [Nocardia farcinica]|uniref:Uncharacterized protein n=1 Tax=Nocardia farcinica TaxID=37329 RepID=A0A449GD44_NOCFR|nr:hypothetical protein [Nocardia farcinica]VFA96073.1 Uncharacterised protein [Nocardia farcinica]